MIKKYWGVALLIAISITLITGKQVYPVIQPIIGFCALAYALGKHRNIFLGIK